jgi:hypothetical protein
VCDVSGCTVENKPKTGAGKLLASFSFPEGIRQPQINKGIDFFWQFPLDQRLKPSYTLIYMINHNITAQVGQTFCPGARA